ncbi:MAG: restriction endonuclease [Nitrososphaerota archaeon]|nr:restriction endonuclease [Nitrososphaerales archaeon]MDW8044935.1 restriction endonuclease [Nitrososphaerota archaeon]
MNPRTLLRIIPEISYGEYSIKEVAKRTRLGSALVEEVLKMLSMHGIGTLTDDRVKFERKDRISAVILAINLGLSIEEASQSLSWRDFEEFVHFFSSQNGYFVDKRVRWKKHGMEIDVLAVKDGIGLLIDCKHWKRTITQSAMRRIVHLQIERARRFMRSRLSSKLNVKFALPVIVTLYSNNINFIDKVPIVPIAKFQNFLSEFLGYLDLIKLIR